MARLTFDPDKTRNNDGPYWAAALVIALQSADRARAETARRRLRRLGVTVRFARPNKVEARR
jgi:hypothetical protein